MASSDDVVIPDLKIPGKRGPFRVRVLDFDEAFDVLFQTDDKTPLMVRLAQACLFNGQGRVYQGNQIEKMKKEVRPAAALMAIGMTAYRINAIQDLMALNAAVDDAEKN